MPATLTYGTMAVTFCVIVAASLPIYFTTKKPKYLVAAGMIAVAACLAAGWILYGE